MWDDVTGRIGSMNPLVWVGLGAAALLGYGARPIVNKLIFIPEAKRETAVIICKSLALVCAILSLLLATEIIG